MRSRTSSGRTGAGGRATVQARIDRGGSYVARAVTQTANGRSIEDTAYLWVTGGAGWYEESRERLRVVTDKKSYRAGETAKVLAETRGVSLEVISQQTTDNFFRLFDKVPRPDATAA